MTIKAASAKELHDDHRILPDMTDMQLREKVIAVAWAKYGEKSPRVLVGLNKLLTRLEITEEEIAGNIPSALRSGDIAAGHKRDQVARSKQTGSQHSSTDRIIK